MKTASRQSCALKVVAVAEKLLYANSVLYVGLYTAVSSGEYVRDMVYGKK